MDFTPDLSAFQGVILSADNVNPFSQLKAKGGNEDKIKNVINTLHNFLQEKNFINNGIVEESIPTLRKFALYIVFNTDLHILQELVNIEEIDLVVWTISIIPKCLMCELMWNLHMEKFIYEIITFTFPPLALEIAESFIDHFKYSNPIDFLVKLKSLSLSCYTAICRYNFFQFGQNKHSQYLTKAFNNFEKCIKYFTDPPNRHKLNELSEDELYKHKGKCLYAALSCVYDCSIQFTSRQEKKPKELDNIYLLTYLKEAVKDCSSYDICDSPNDILELLDNCHVVLLDTVKELVMDVNVDIFCAWNEFEDNGRTMQQVIGELCYKLRTKLLEIPCFSEHPLVNMIQQIAKKPVDAKELINSLDTESIIANINKNNDEKQKWLHALINKEQLCKHTELLQIVDGNLHDYNEEECFKLYEILRSSTENKNITEALSVKVFHHCNVTAKYKILNDNFIKNCFVNMNETPEFNNMLTETFNKFVILPDEDLTNILTLFLQNPHKVYTKIFNLAIENSPQTNIMLRVMKLIESFSNHYYETETEPCIIKVLQNTIDLLETDPNQSNFIKFTKGLKEANVIPGSKLLLLIITPNIHKSLLNKNIYNINTQIKLLRDIYPLEEIVEYRAPMLAMLAQVLDVLRWKIDTFEALAPSSLQITLGLQKSLIATYNNSVPDKESKWLKCKVGNLQPLNMYYYRCLWDPPGNNFLEVISNRIINMETSTDEITTCLIQIICSTTQQEWCDIWDSLKTFDNALILNMFHQAMTVVDTAERIIQSSTACLCLLYCYRNLIYLIRYKYLKEPLTDDQVSVVIKTITTMPIVKRGKLDELEPLLMPLFSYLAERKNDYTTDLSANIPLKQKNLINLVNKVFSKEIK